jgi:hypothetical protein
VGERTIILVNLRDENSQKSINLSRRVKFIFLHTLGKSLERGSEDRFDEQAQYFAILSSKKLLKRVKPIIMTS